jgi:hypothetical protein
MDDPETTLSFRPAAWSRRVDRWIGRIDGMDSARLAWHRRRADAGLTYLLAGYAGRKMVVVMILSEQDGPCGPELLCELAAGDLSGADLTRAMAVAGEAVARRAGMRACRFATVRPGLARKTVLLGYELVEVQMRKAFDV